MAVILTICAVLLFYSLNESRVEPEGTGTPVPPEEPLTESPLPQEKDPVCYYVIGTPGDSVPGRIYRNICTLMEDLGLTWQGAPSVHMENLKPDRSLVILCGDTVSALADPRQTEAYLAAGGRMILAAGLSEKNEDTYLQPVLGIVEKTVRITPARLHFLLPYLPVQEEFMGYTDYNASFWLRLQDEARVYLEDEDNHAPLIYSFPHEKGEVLVFNTTLLCDSRCMGLLTAGIGTLLDTFLYPVVGAEVIFLDNFPLVLTADDRESMALYGRSADAFVRDILWPAFQGMALRGGIPYTASVTAVSTREDRFQDINDSLFAAMSRSILQFDMELAYGAFHEGDREPMLHTGFLAEMGRSLPDYAVFSMTSLTDQGMEADLEALGGDIRFLRGSFLSPDPLLRFSRQGDRTVFPWATQGTDLDSGGMLALASVYASHGMISHRFNIQEFLGGQDGVPLWDTQKRRLEDFEKRVLGEFPGLTPLSLRETGNLVKSYVNSSCVWTLEGRELTLHADRFIPGQAFFLRSEQPIREARGAEFQSIGEHYYLIRQQEAESILYLSEGN